MTIRPRSLFTKIFLWFCLTIAASTSLVLILAGLTSSQPFGRRWMEMTQDLYAHSAVDFYSTGGKAALIKYLQTIEHDSGIEGHLLDAQGVDVLGATFPANTSRVYQEAKRSGKSAVRVGRHWTAASVVHTSATYIFVMEAHPRRGFLDGTFVFAAFPRLLGATLLAALLCLVLARHIVQPIRVLEEAAAQMAKGDLSVRTLPALLGRTDELATMAAAFDSMAERIETLLSTQHQMLADISHELRSPLTRIGVSLELIRRGEMDVLDPMQSDLDQLNQMIGQILDLMRFELHKPIGPQRAIDLLPVVEDVVESANHEGRNEGKLVVLGTSGQACMIEGEEAALRSCVENVVRNALQFTPPGGRIDITLSRVEPSRVVVRVDDNGPGVPDDTLPFLFAPFFRVPGSQAAHPQGSGLGLSLSSRIVARSGGEITAANRSPHGLSVCLTFPISQA